MSNFAPIDKLYAHCIRFTNKTKTMTHEELTSLHKADTDGMLTYEYIANNIGTCDEDLPQLASLLAQVDKSGQFTASAARFLHAIDATKYADIVSALVAATIDRDREHKYLPDLMQSLYGTDYTDRVAELSVADNNFRRIYKRLYPNSSPM